MQALGCSTYKHGKQPKLTSDKSQLSQVGQKDAYRCLHGCATRGFRKRFEHI
jgi:hypothetical protein